MRTGNCDRYATMDGLRAFAAIGIVMLHVFSVGEYAISGFIGEKLIPSFVDLVFLFMVLSAFNMCCGYYDKFKSGSVKLEIFYARRYKKVLPFFAFLCMLDICIAPSKESLYEFFGNITLMFGLLPNANISVIGVGWFLGVVFAFYLLFPFFTVLIANHKRAWMAFGVSIVYNIVCQLYYFDDSHVLNNFSDRTNIIYCFMFFMAGGIIYLYREEIGRLKTIVSASCVCVAIILFFWSDRNIFTSMMLSAAFMMFAIQINLIKAPSRIEKGVKRLLSNRLTDFVSSISLEVYLCHMLFYRVAEKVGILRVVNNEILSYAVAVIVVLSASVIFSVVAQKTIKYFGNLISDAIDKINQ